LWIGVNSRKKAEAATTAKEGKKGEKRAAIKSETTLRPSANRKNPWGEGFQPNIAAQRQNERVKKGWARLIMAGRGEGCIQVGERQLWGEKIKKKKQKITRAIFESRPRSASNSHPTTNGEGD